MTITKPKIKYSVIIPTYNHLEDCLKPCIESILQYTDMDNLEIVIVANGCADGTKEYLESLNCNNIIVVWSNDALGFELLPKNLDIPIQRSKIVENK